MNQPLTRHSLPASLAKRTITPGILLEMYDEPVLFHRAFVEMGGGITAALFLSYACQATAELSDESEGWMRLTIAQWSEATCLTRTEQESARRNLRDQGLIEERRIGMPARLEIRVNVARLIERLQAQANRKYQGLDQMIFARLD